jgi:hypothetical protein
MGWLRGTRREDAAQDMAACSYRGHKTERVTTTLFRHMSGGGTNQSMEPYFVDAARAVFEQSSDQHTMLEALEGRFEDDETDEIGPVPPEVYDECAMLAKLFIGRVDLFARWVRVYEDPSSYSVGSPCMMHDPVTDKVHIMFPAEELRICFNAFDGVEQALAAVARVTSTYPGGVAPPWAFGNALSGILDYIVRGDDEDTGVRPQKFDGALNFVVLNMMDVHPLPVPHRPGLDDPQCLLETFKECLQKAPQ